MIERTTGRVIGVVVEKWTLWSPKIELVINGFEHPKGGMLNFGNFSYIGANGQRVDESEQEAIASVLKEFYEQSQVMIGNAISVSELNAFIKPGRDGVPICGRH
jgi:hypothetical protein